MYDEVNGKQQNRTMILCKIVILFYFIFLRKEFILARPSLEIDRLARWKHNKQKIETK